MQIKQIMKACSRSVAHEPLSLRASGTVSSRG